MNMYFQKALPYLISSAVILGISGCGPKVKLTEYKPAPIAKADIMPTPSELEHKKPKVVVMALQNGSTELVRRVDGGKSVADSTEAILVNSKLVELVDRNAAVKLQNELSLVELKGDSGKMYQGPEVAEIAISGALSSGSVSSKFTASVTTYDKKGRSYTSPATCSYQGSVSGTMKLYELPSLKVIDSFSLSGSNSYSEEGYCKSNFDQEGLISKAAENAPNAIKVALLNQFSPKGYITERRNNDGKTIFLAQLGAQHGAAYNLKVKLYAMRSSVNPLNGTMSNEEVFIGEGKISDQITPNTSWILIEDKEVADQIRLGDYVKYDYKKGIADLFI